GGCHDDPDHDCRRWSAGAACHESRSRVSAPRGLSSARRTVEAMPLSPPRFSHSPGSLRIDRQHRRRRLRVRGYLGANAGPTVVALSPAVDMVVLADGAGVVLARRYGAEGHRRDVVEFHRQWRRRRGRDARINAGAELTVVIVSPAPGISARIQRAGMLHAG